MPDVFDALREEARTATPRQKKALGWAAIVMAVMLLGPGLFFLFTVMRALIEVS